MTAEELLQWALENVHGSEWRFKMIMKVSEQAIRNLTDEQVKAIEWFCNTVFQQKFYQGSGGVVRVSDISDTLKTIGEIRKENNEISQD